VNGRGLPFDLHDLEAFLTQYRNACFQENKIVAFPGYREFFIRPEPARFVFCEDRCNASASLRALSNLVGDRLQGMKNALRLTRSELVLLYLYTFMEILRRLTPLDFFM